MAKKEQNIMLLQEVVGQLRKLNASSVRDRLREAEEAKRAEKIALMSEEQLETEGLVVDSTEDFRRRFVAGQAKTLVDSNLTKTASGERDKERNKLLEQIAGVQETFKLEDFGNPSKANQEKAFLAPLSVGMYAEGVKSINVRLEGIHETLKSIFIQDKNVNEDDKQYRNNQQRAQDEARREAINLNRLGAGRRGGVDGETLALPDPNSGSGGLGMGAAIAVVALKAWNWTKRAALAFTAWGKKIFSKFKLTPKQTKMLANPRKWPLVLAGVLAAGFLGMKFLGDEGEDTSDDSVLPGDLEDLPEESALASNMDTLFTVALTGGLLSKSKIVQNVAKGVGEKVRKAYKAAPKTSLRGKLYANAGFKKGLSLTGRGLLRFMGPWGMGAWIAWELSSFALKKFSNQEKEGEEALKEIEDLQMQNIDSVLGDPDLEAMFSDPSGPRNFAGTAKKGAIKSRIRALMEGKSIEQKNKLKKELMTLGWTASELAPLMGSTSTYSPLNRDRDGLISKLEVQEKERTSSFAGPAGAGKGGVFNSGNTIIGDTVTNIHHYVQGYQASSFEGRKAYTPGN